MRKEIRLMLDYQCYPIWIYDEEGNFLDNDLVNEIQENENLLNMLEKLQNKFDALYLNNEVEFKYIGFESEDDKKKFIDMVQETYKSLCSVLVKKYIVQNKIDIHNI